MTSVCLVVKRHNSSVAFNKLRFHHHQMTLNNSEQSRKLRKPAEAPSIYSTKETNNDLRAQIRNADHGKRIVRLIKENSDTIEDPSIYGAAMSKCNKLRDYQSTFYLMHNLIKSEFQLNHILFNIFFNGMCYFDQPKISKKYFKLMIKKHRITPDVITFSILIKGCRYQPSLYKLAEKYWKLMEINHIKPHELLYTEMITVYSKASKKKKAIKIFNEYKSRLNKNELKWHLPAFGAYLTVFTRCGDINTMNQIFDEIQLQNKSNINAIIYGDMMRGYIVANKQEECVSMFNTMINNGITASRTHLFLKLISIFQVMCRDKSSLNNEQRLELFNKIEHEINVEFPFYNIPVQSIEATVYLGGAIVTFYDSDPMKIVKLFKYLFQSKLIAYLRSTDGDRTYCIELHCFQPWEAQFIMRYILAFKINDILKQNEMYGLNKLCIIVGTGKHNKPNKKNNLREIVMNDLMSYDPPINAVINIENKGRINIDHSQLIQYRNNIGNDQNSAFRKLQHQYFDSNDWYLHLHNEQYFA